MSVCRMHDHVLRLIDNYNIAVLIDYIERDILRQNVNISCLRLIDLYYIAATQDKPGLNL